MENKTNKDGRRLLFIVVIVVISLFACLGIGFSVNNMISKSRDAKATAQAAATIIDLLPIEPGTPRSPAEETAAAQTLAAAPPAVQTAVAQTVVALPAAQTATAQAAATQTALAIQTGVVRTAMAQTAAVQTSVVQTAAAQTLAMQPPATQTAAAQTAAAQTVAAVQTAAARTSVARTAAARTATVQTAAAQTAAAQTLAALSATPTFTRTPLPTVTRNPSDTFTSTMTVATPTGTPTRSRTYTPTNSATPTATRVPGACENVLFPLASGRYWVYDANIRSNSYVMEMDSRNVTDSRANVDFWNITRSIVSSGMVNCNSGALVNMPLFLFDMTVDSFLNGDVNAQYLGGLAAPSRAMFEDYDWNLRWIGHYWLNGSGTAPFQGNTYSVEFDGSELIMTCDTAGFEAVTVTAGSFPSALKVVCSYDTPATVGLNGAFFTGRLMATTTQWFALDVGMLRAQVDSLSIHYVIYDLIVNVTATAELQTYGPP